MKAGGNAFCSTRQIPLDSSLPKPIDPSISDHFTVRILYELLSSFPLRAVEEIRVNSIVEMAILSAETLL